MDIRPHYSNGELITLGDWVCVYVPRLGVWHHGIVRNIYRFGNGYAVQIAHNLKSSGVTVSDWYEFADGGQVVLHARASSHSHVQQILARVDANIGKPYKLFAQNCEHFASFCFSGKAESKSVQVVGALAAVAIIIAFLGGR